MSDGPDGSVENPGGGRYRPWLDGLGMGLL